MEAVQFIYTSNIFCFQDITAYFCFQRRCPDDFFQAVRYLQLTWSNPWHPFEYFERIPPWGISYWTRVWQEISEMKALSHVRVYMEVRDPCIMAPHEDLYFSTLEAVHVGEMEVCVSWEGYEEAGRKHGWREWTARREAMESS
jgi:hypothetical protein